MSISDLSLVQKIMVGSTYNIVYFFILHYIVVFLQKNFFYPLLHYGHMITDFVSD